jgi:ribulose-5-phosphate 4-epimerase/fuculose-1-phosphate aldolase
MNPKELVAAYAKKGFSEHLFAGTSGNLSMFDPKTGKMYITASGIRYEEMTAEDVMVTDLNGAVLEGRHRPSSEWRMHAAVYRAYPRLRAVVHTHSPYATAFAVCREPIPAALIEMHFFLGGDIPCAPYARPGTDAVGESAVPLLTDKGGCLLANHGVLAVGKDLQEAYLRAEYIEDAAKIYSLAKGIGQPVLLNGLDS